MSILDLYARQQISLMMALNATTREARHSHAGLASAYGVRIKAIRDAAFLDDRMVPA